MKKNKNCSHKHHEQIKHHIYFHKFFKTQVRMFNKKHRKFSRKVFLTFGIFTIVTLFTVMIMISGIFSFVRYNYQKILLQNKIEDLNTFIKTNSHFENEEYLDNLVYQDIFIKLVKIENNQVIFDTYTGFLKNTDKNKTFLPFISDEVKINEKYQLFILKDIRTEQNLIRHYILIMLLTNLIFIAMIMKGSKLLTFRLLMPINHIIQVAENIDAANLSQRVPIIPIDDEINRLGRVINNMIDRLEKSFNTQKKFVSDASHELRTPLQIIKGYTDLALKKGDNRELLHEALTNVREEIEHMTNLTETLLFLAKSEGQSMKIDKEIINLNKLFHKIKTDLVLTKKKITFNIPSLEEVDAFVNEKLILQAFRAVIDNGIKYSEDEAVINIEYTKNSTNTTVIIKDQGIGIAKENTDKIFNRFYRVDEARSKEIDGTGLGLAIVKNIIELHGGEISVNSEINKGTSVIFTLPNN